MAFFQKLRGVFHIAKINTPYHYPELEIPPITVNNLFKFQAQHSDLEYLFWQCEKHIAISEKKTPLALLCIG